MTTQNRPQQPHRPGVTRRQSFAVLAALVGGLLAAACRPFPRKPMAPPAPPSGYIGQRWIGAGRIGVVP